jgi:hypothetical protein
MEICGTRLKIYGCECTVYDIKIVGLVRDLNPGPRAPEARIIPLDQRAELLMIVSYFSYTYIHSCITLVCQLDKTQCICISILGTYAYQVISALITRLFL